jgi:hypothetical protein
MQSLEKKSWWNYIEGDLQELLSQSFLLLELSEKNPSYGFHDFSFVVFPAAKAYEGFLKKLFLDLGFISEADYLGKRWRVGKALNPFLEKEIRNESVYDRIKAYCGGGDLGDILWETWKGCRNSVFHFFPNEKNVVSLEDASIKLDMIIAAMDQATEECRLPRNKV